MQSQSHHSSALLIRQSWLPPAPPAGVKRYALRVGTVGEPLPQARLQPQQPWSVRPAAEQCGVRRLSAVLRPVALQEAQACFETTRNTRCQGGRLGDLRMLQERCAAWWRQDAPVMHLLQDIGCFCEDADMGKGNETSCRVGFQEASHSVDVCILSSAVGTHLVL